MLTDTEKAFRRPAPPNILNDDDVAARRIPERMSVTDRAGDAPPVSLSLKQDGVGAFARRPVHVGVETDAVARHHRDSFGADDGEQILHGDVRLSSTPGQQSMCHVGGLTAAWHMRCFARTTVSVEANHDRHQTTRSPKVLVPGRQGLHPSGSADGLHAAR